MPTQDLVLIGGGHSHAIALRLFGQKPLPGIRLTLLTEQADTAYSGMLPGHIAGLYHHQECHIDLRALTQFAGAVILLDRAIGLNLARQQIFCADRSPIRFDWVSIDIGSTPTLPVVFQATAPGINIPIKPVAQFLQQWQQVIQEVANHPHRPLSLGIVGGGVGGVELALALQQRLEQLLASPELLTLHLFQRGSTLLSGHSIFVQQTFDRILLDRGISVHCKETVCAVAQHQVICKSGLAVTCDRVFWVTEASAPEWLRESGLAVDQRGFLQVHPTLQSTSHPQVFAAGDIATIVGYPRPKAGVFAVRQGKPLFENLCRVLQGRSLQPHYPQQRYLSLIGTGGTTNTPPKAIASWGPLGIGPSPLLWQWKDWIDRRFMAQFQNYPQAAR
ncbi:FAD-dependent oxidoreductase [Leptolyngbya sp. 'hensonii']|uniref:FAD-dependent oxidoreductase n=1 Tax=Leptolyngbya sp. 'hensonii' TaxID=1922337 RepID=UPI0009F9132E|nr:FAD-dependent oxidoreductase [Leptolyngbya sp. 'hensonii']